MTNIASTIKTVVNDDHVVVFNLMIALISAERQFDLTNLGIDLESLPSASKKLLQEKIYPKEFLNNYSRLRDRANSVLEKGAAVRCEIGVVSSRSEAVNKIELLNAIEADWNAQLAADKPRYDQVCNERISFIAAQAFDEGVPANVVNLLVQALRKRQPQWEEFERSVRFKYSAMPVKLELDEQSSGFDPILFKAQRDGVVALREGVMGGLIQFLTREAVDLLKVLNGKQPKDGSFAINHRTVSRIAAVTEKLHGLVFIHPNAAPLAKLIDDALGFMPKSSAKDLHLPTPNFLNLIACLEAMSDQHVLHARLRDRQPLISVTIEAPQAPMQATAPVAQAAPVVAAPQVTAAAEPAQVQEEKVQEDDKAVQEEVVMENEIESIPETAQAVQGEEEIKFETPAAQPAQPIADKPKLFDLPFLGTSFFG